MSLTASAGCAPIPHAPGFYVVTPIYNDWAAVSFLLQELDRVLAQHKLSTTVMLVDDGSTMPCSPAIGTYQYVAISRIEVLALRRNMGHQRAIAIALAYLEDRVKPEAVLIMDGDGEDSPEDVPRLAARLRERGGQEIVFAERTRRSETLHFRLFYNAYRYAHLVLTGIAVRVGNFSIVPLVQLRRLVVVSELWNHYAAAVFKARLPRTSITTVRRPRLAGRPSMNFAGLIGHGLSALSVHAELIGVRLLITTAVAVGVLCALLFAVVGVRTLTPYAIPGWATTAAGLIVVLLFQAIAFAVFFVLLILHGRSQPSFIPIRDYSYFIGDVVILFPGRTSEPVRHDRTEPGRQ
jgi:hypothetical protein